MKTLTIKMSGHGRNFLLVSYRLQFAEKFDEEEREGLSPFSGELLPGLLLPLPRIMTGYLFIFTVTGTLPENNFLELFW